MTRLRRLGRNADLYKGVVKYIDKANDTRHRIHGELSELVEAQPFYLARQENGHLLDGKCQICLQGPRGDRTGSSEVQSLGEQLED